MVSLSEVAPCELLMLNHLRAKEAMFSFSSAHSVILASTARPAWMMAGMFLGGCRALPGPWPGRCLTGAVGRAGLWPARFICVCGQSLPKATEGAETGFEPRQPGPGAAPTAWSPREPSCAWVQRDPARAVSRSTGQRVSAGGSMAALSTPGRRAVWCAWAGEGTLVHFLNS